MLCNPDFYVLLKSENLSFTLALPRILYLCVYAHLHMHPSVHVSKYIIIIIISVYLFRYFIQNTRNKTKYSD